MMDISGIHFLDNAVWNTHQASENAFDDERWLMNDFHSADPELKIKLANRFKDKRSKIIAQRIVYENCRDLISLEKLLEYDERVKNRMHIEDEVPWTTVSKAISECDALQQKDLVKSQEINHMREYLHRLSK